MRIRDGFTLDTIPELRMLLVSRGLESDSHHMDETPDPRIWGRRFSFLDEPGSASENASETLVIVAAGARLETLATLNAALVLAEGSVVGIPNGIPVIRIRDARTTLAVLLNALSDRIEREKPFAQGSDNIVHPSAVVEGVLEGGVMVEAGVYVASGSFIGRGTRLEANSVVREHCVIGKDCIVQSGAVIGGAGFGFFTGKNSAELMPHLSGVRIGSRCFIGANTVIAAGVLHPTTIEDGCKLDSHVQNAHNVRLGAGSMLASQSGVAGSTVIGKNFRMGGAASVAGHLRIGDNVSVAARSGVTKDVQDGMTVAGFPARPIGEWRRDVVSDRYGRP